MPEKGYPEHEKLARVKDESQAIGEFLDMGPGVLCEWREQPDVPRWIHPETGTDRTPRDTQVTMFHNDAIENPDWFPAGHYPIPGGVQKILADYFDIDLDKIETEKRQMLDEMRALNANRS